MDDPMKSLRDRIAAAALNAYAGDGAWDMSEGDIRRSDWREVADAVIAELGWRQEWCVEYTPEGESPATTQLAEWSCSHERITNDRERAQWDATSWARDCPDEQPHVVARYVTEWTADE